MGVYFLSETVQIANHQCSLQRLDLLTLDPTSQNALRRPFSGVGAKQRQLLLAKGAQFANALDPGGSLATLNPIRIGSSNKPAFFTAKAAPDALTLAEVTIANGCLGVMGLDIFRSST